MKRPMITMDEYMSMSIEELDEYHDRDERLIAEGLVDKNRQLLRTCPLIINIQLFA